MHMMHMLKLTVLINLFEVHLPNYSESYFSVRDFGYGMSEDQILTLFTTYFDSDKADSNKFVGALGLGSKSAFAYTDSFTVESWNGGMYKMYSCYISESGTPQISKMIETETNETGFMVKFNVAKDHDEFISKAQSIYRFFKTIPTFTGNQINIPHEMTSFSGIDWTISKLNRYDNYSGAFAVQGNIAYRLDPKSLGKLTDKQSFVLNNNFRIDFPLGDLDIAASREYLSYDVITIENIKKKT